MVNKVLVIPDVHGKSFWREPVSRYLASVDRVVFLGDYLDPYEPVSSEVLFNNLMDIIKLKQENPDKVILLKGNHDEHYSSRTFYDLACGSRVDYQNWDRNHEVFNEYKDLFQLVHLEQVNDVPFVFSHAGLTAYWINKVNDMIWRLNDRDVSVAKPEMIDRLNQLDETKEGQKLLTVIGEERSRWGEETGSVLWADVEEHPIFKASKIYGLNQVFQVFGHTNIAKSGEDMIEGENLAMIDSQQCFMIDGNMQMKIMTIDKYEKATNVGGKHGRSKEMAKKEKILFLDIDGVLNTGYWYNKKDKNTPKDEYGYAFDPNAVANLREIIDKSGADIVISSSWKFMGLDQLREMWKERNMPGNIIDVTPNTMSDEFLLNADLDNIDILNIRGQEIKEWLILHGKKVSHYVILDDMDDMLKEQQDHFVWIDPEVGITEGNALQAIMILNQ